MRPPMRPAHGLETQLTVSWPLLTSLPGSVGSDPHTYALPALMPAKLPILWLEGPRLPRSRG